LAIYQTYKTYDELILNEYITRVKIVDEIINDVNYFKKHFLLIAIYRHLRKDKNISILTFKNFLGFSEKDNLPEVGRFFGKTMEDLHKLGSVAKTRGGIDPCNGFEYKRWQMLMNSKSVEKASQYFIERKVKKLSVKQLQSLKVDH